MLSQKLLIMFIVGDHHYGKYYQYFQYFFQYSKFYEADTRPAMLHILIHVNSISLAGLGYLPIQYQKHNLGFYCH